MKVSVEISFYPLQKEFTKPIFNFIERLNQHGLTVKTNGMSSQVFGEFDKVMTAINKEVKVCFKDGGTNVFVMKIVSGDLSDY